jgi:predicted site-specific integrase-resolvase
MSIKPLRTRHRAYGYCRVSTADQADFGVSLDAQTERIRAWCQLNGYEVGGILVDRGLSGGRCDNRPVPDVNVNSPSTTITIPHRGAAA